MTKLETPVNKESIDKIGKPFNKTSALYPLTNFETPLNEETIDKIGTPFY